MKNFVEQISIKFKDLYLIKMNLVYKLCCRQAHQNICGNLYIGRYSNAQLPADNIVDRYIGRFLLWTHQPVLATPITFKTRNKQQRRLSGRLGDSAVARQAEAEGHNHKKREH